MVYRQPYFSLRIEHAAEITPSNRKVRSRLDCLQVAGLEKQNAVYSGFIRELKGTRAAHYARPPIAAPQLLSLFHTLSLSIFLFLSLHPLVVNLEGKRIYFITLCHFCFLASPCLSPTHLQTLDNFHVSLEPKSLHEFFFLIG